MPEYVHAPHLVKRQATLRRRARALGHPNWVIRRSLPNDGVLLTQAISMFSENLLRRTAGIPATGLADLSSRVPRTRADNAGPLRRATWSRRGLRS
jgi:hypothetical protein